jgi:hypothetical protein
MLDLIVQQIDCYVYERMAKKQRPISFKLVHATTIVNPTLEQQFEAGLYL